MAEIIKNNTKERKELKPNNLGDSIRRKLTNKDFTLKCFLKYELIIIVLLSFWCCI